MIIFHNTATEHMYNIVSDSHFFPLVSWFLMLLPAYHLTPPIRFEQICNVHFKLDAQKFN